MPGIRNDHSRITAFKSKINNAIVKPISNDNISRVMPPINVAESLDAMALQFEAVD